MSTKADPKAVALGWNDDTLPIGTHACYVYSDEETLKKGLSFVRVGLDADGEFCVIFADTSRFDQLLGWLQEGYEGDVRGLIESGKLAVIGGAPTLEGLLSNITSCLDRATADGYDLIRFLGFIAWGHRGWPDDLTLQEFESRVNAAVTAYPAIVICTYGVPRINGGTAFDNALLDHPVSVSG